MEKKRSVGLTIIGALFIIGSILSVAMLFLAHSPVILSLTMIVFFGFALIGFYAGVGILMLKPSARILAIALLIVKIPYGIINTFKDFNILISGSPIPIPLVLLPLFLGIVLVAGINIGIIFYLTRPKVKEQFK